MDKITINIESDNLPLERMAIGDKVWIKVEGEQFPSAWRKIKELQKGGVVVMHSGAEIFIPIENIAGHEFDYRNQEGE